MAGEIVKSWFVAALNKMAGKFWRQFFMMLAILTAACLVALAAAQLGYSTASAPSIISNTALDADDVDQEAPKPVPPAGSAFPYIWPLPQAFTNGSTNMSVNPASFAISTNVSSADLDNAITRYLSIIFPHEDSTNVSGSTVIFGIQINIGNVSVPLQLYADESYTIDIPNYSGYITITAGTGLLNTTLDIIITFLADVHSVRRLPCAGDDLAADAVQLQHRDVLYPLCAVDDRGLPSLCSPR